MDSKKIGKFIAELRKEKNMTQEDLAQQLLVDRTMVSKWERGVYIPNTEILLRFQEIFNISINEIVYGERKNKDNNDKIDSVSIDIIKKNRKRIRLILFISFTIIILLSTLFLLYYFINNYNSIRVYKISGDANNIVVSNGLMVVSKEKSYIRVGDILNNSENKITSVRLFFRKGDNEYDIFIGTEENTKMLLINDFDYNELYKYNDLNFILKNLFLEVKLDNEKLITIKLDLKKDFSNNYIFSEKNRGNISDNNINNFLSNVPKYIKDNFTLNEKTEEYIKENKKDSVIEKYLYNANLYVVIIQRKNSEEQYEFSLSTNSMTYNLFENESITETYTYDLNDKKCLYGNCDIDSINDIINKYYSAVLK